MWVEFLVTSLVVVVSPGTGVLYTIGIGLARGLAASTAAAVGCTLGIVPHMAAAIFGLAALLHTSALAFQVLKFAGVAYLFYMAWVTVRSGGALEVTPAHEKKTLGRIALTGGLINILNPKLSIFFLAFLPQFVTADTTAPIAQMLVLSAVFMAMTFVVFVIYGAFAWRLRQHVIGRPSVMVWMRRCFAAAFVALGARLTFATL
jgi:threonine/homoserine/homoserine lactone efflux protein